jgi:NAD+ synthase
MMEKLLINTLLKIDAERTLDKLVHYLQSLIQDHSMSGILLGLSGGIDSSLLSAIAVEALGRQSIHLAYLYDQHSNQEQFRNALAVSQFLSVEIEKRSIEQAMRDLRIYSSIGMKITSLSGRLNRILYKTYGAIFNETPFISSLKIGNREKLGNISKGFDFREIIQQPEAGMNARHIYRRKVLEEQAASNGWLLIGAANRTEWQVGWFVKDGIDDLSIQPIKGLYKTQVRQLALDLQLPIGVITQFPSPDMTKGITDEFALGMSYRKIDLALDYLDGGLTREEIAEAGFSEDEIQRVREMNRLSSWKRGTRPTDLPVDGSSRGGLRVKPG